MFRELIVLYSKTLRNDNLYLDWNLKNFIISKGNIYYIDYVPALYKNKIKELKSERLEQYKTSYLDRKVFLCMMSCIEEILNIKYDDNYLTDHVYIKKINMIFNYLNSNQDYETFIEKYKFITMEKTAVKKKAL